MSSCWTPMPARICAQGMPGKANHHQHTGGGTDDKAGDREAAGSSARAPGVESLCNQAVEGLEDFMRSKLGLPLV